MLLRSAYFESTMDNKHWKLALSKRTDMDGLILISVEKGKEEPPFISVYVTEEIPQKVAKLWKVPYSKMFNPMVKAKVTFDTTPVLQHWKDYDRLVEYSDSEHVGDPRNKEWQEKVATTAWQPLMSLNPEKPFTDNPKIEYFIVNHKNVGGNIIPGEDIPVTNKQIIKEMAQYGIGSGYPKNRSLRLKANKPDEIGAKEPRYVPTLTWQFNKEEIKKESAADIWYLEHPGILKSDFAPLRPTSHHIESFSIEMVNEEIDVAGYHQKATNYSPGRFSEDFFEEYNNEIPYENYAKLPDGPTI